LPVTSAHITAMEISAMTRPGSVVSGLCPVIRL